LRPFLPPAHTRKPAPAPLLHRCAILAPRSRPEPYRSSSPAPARRSGAAPRSRPEQQRSKSSLWPPRTAVGSSSVRQIELVLQQINLCPLEIERRTAMGSSAGAGGLPCADAAKPGCSPPATQPAEFALTRTVADRSSRSPTSPPAGAHAPLSHRTRPPRRSCCAWSCRAASALAPGRRLAVMRWRRAGAPHSEAGQGNSRARARRERGSGSDLSEGAAAD
jgi:hypothetical protein